MSFSAEKKKPSCRQQESTGEYVNEGLGPNISSVENTEYRQNTSTTVGRVSEQRSQFRHYDTIESCHRDGSCTLANHISNDAGIGQTTTRSIPVSAMQYQLNSTYGNELPTHSKRSQKIEPSYHNMPWRTIDNV